MRNTNRLITFTSLIGILALPAFILAQSGRAAAIPEKQQTPAPTDSGPLDKVKLVLSTDIESFVKDLNVNGKLGYRLDRSLNYGGEGPRQSYAAVLRLDAGNIYEYDWLTSPEIKQLEARLNYQAGKGFHFVDAYALTYCAPGTSEDNENPSGLGSVLFRLKKGTAFILERKNGSVEQTREYKVFIAKLRLGVNARKTIQAGVNAAAPQGFRPVKILAARQDLFDFSISVLVERNSQDSTSSMIEYRFVHKTFGFPKEVNALAAQGFRLMAGKQLGLTAMALMAKQSNDTVTYTFVDEKKYDNEFDKTISLGNSYQGVIAGDVTCGASQVENERLVFAPNSGGEKHEYKIQNVAITGKGKPDADSSLEIHRLLAENYQIKDLFYYYGLKLIFEK